MIRALQLLSDPFLARRDEAEDAYDRRFQPTEIECKYCEGWGSRLEDAMEIVRCPKCRNGFIDIELCVKCDQTEANCECNVSDF